MSAKWGTADDLTGRPRRLRRQTMLSDMGRESEAVLVHGLRKSYQGHQAVDGIDLDISRGEAFALLGPNGAGKTTTVDILAGQQDRDAGTVEVLGIDPANAGRGRQGRNWRIRIGVVAQSAGTIPELT